MKVVKWISNEEADKLPEDHQIFIPGGWVNFNCKGDRWKDYIDGMKDEFVERAEAVREKVLADNLRFDGNYHQYGKNGVPLFDDGKCFTFSQRAWGDLMASIWSEAEDKDYCYVEYYIWGTDPEVAWEEKEQSK